MLKPAADRLDYGDMLQPPEGYVLESAIGTTYSLDMETLIAIAISLGLLDDTDSEGNNNPLRMLHALQKVADKMLIFCEAGQIKLPRKVSPLSLLLEKMIVQVALDSNQGIKMPSFHPKTWVITYVDKNKREDDAGKRLYKFAVLSRNLTFDRSWDVAVALNGHKTAVNKRKTKPLVAFLEFLAGKIYDDSFAKEKGALLKRVIADVATVAFEIEDDRFYDYNILPLGIGGKYNATATYLEEGDNHETKFSEIFIISPFLSRNFITGYNNIDNSYANAKRTLVTRSQTLKDFQPDDISNFDVYVLADTIVDGELDSDNIGEDWSKQDIHAKCFLYKTNNRDYCLYLGSSNATHAAFNANVEMLLGLWTTGYYLNSDKLLSELLGDADSKTLRKVEGQELESFAELEKAEDLVQKIKLLCRFNSRGEVNARNDKYSIELTFAGLEQELRTNVFISPLLKEEWKLLDEKLTFADLDILQLSEFYKVRVNGGEESSVERVIIIPTYNMPDGRDKAVVNSIIRDEESFLKYLYMALDENFAPYMSDDIMEKHVVGNVMGHGTNVVLPAFYEKLLKISLEDKDRIKDIDYVMSMVEDKETISDGFRKMYDTFKNALGK